MADDGQDSGNNSGKVVSLATARELRTANHKARRRAVADPEGALRK